jgi:pyrrolysine biosynthesis protein PylD
MTRLTTSDIDAVAAELDHYDRYLRSATGQSLLNIGAAAAGIPNTAALRKLVPTIKMAVVPIRSGLGIISGFAGAVGAICKHLGFDVSVTANTDVAGFAEAVENGAEGVLAADDDRFVAFCPGPRKVVDNTPATARGFVAGLDLLAGGLEGRVVLVLGCGPVGRWAADALLARKAQVRVLDPVPGKAAELAGWAAKNRKASIQVLTDAEQALIEHDLIFDATNAADVIHDRHVTDATRVAAPGMPCGLTNRALDMLQGRVLHDPLQIGVAAMACEAVRILQASDGLAAIGEQSKGA